MERAQLERLAARGWRLTHDGSISTATLVWDDPDDPDSGWELMVFHTAGHGATFTLTVHGEGLSTRRPTEAARLRDALTDASELMADWHGETLDP